jgi:hypothetical protein
VFLTKQFVLDDLFSLMEIHEEHIKCDISEIMSIAA